MVKALFHILFLVMVVRVHGQEYLNPDRPNESKTPELVKGNNLQLEVGLKKEKDKRQAKPVSTSPRAFKIWSFQRP